MSADTHVSVRWLPRPCSGAPRALACALLLTLSVAALAATPFETGNAHYQQADYASAQQQYLTQLAQGPVTAPLLYNLGNTCFRLQQTGWAILYYERALLYTPRDRDLRANLATAVATRHTPPPTDAPGWTQVVVRQLLDALTLNELASLSSLTYFLACALLLWRLRTTTFRRRYLWLLYAALALAVVCMALSATKAHLDHHPGRAVIVLSSDLKSGPADNFQTVRKVYEGEMAHLTGRQGVWRQIRLETGTTGWLAQSAVEPVVPARQPQPAP